MITFITLGIGDMHTVMSGGKEPEKGQHDPKCVVKILCYARISRPPDFRVIFWCFKLGLYASIYGIP